MKKIALFLAILAVPAITLMSCSKNSPTAPSLAPDQGKMMFALDAADNIATGQVTVTKGALTHVLPITITDHSGTVTFAGIQVGHWNILVQLFDVDGAEIYTGTGEAIVTKNATTTVTIRVEHNTGTLIINVEVPGLVFWNKMGSMTELQNSEEGPGFDHIQGIKEFAPVQHGNGVEVYDVGGNGVHVLTPAPLGNMKAGAIEYWYLSNSTEITREAEYLAGINDPTYSKINLGSAMYWDAGYNGNCGLYFGIYDGTSNHSIQTGTVPNANITFSTTEPTHLAFVWDWDGINGSADTMRVYRDGVLLLSSQDVMAAWDDSVTEYMIAGTGDYRPTWHTAPNGKVDNLKIWNYSKTDFSDRFVE